GGYVIQASSGTLVPVATSAITVSPTAASHLVLSAAPPATVNAGSGFGLSVTALDPFGNVDTSFGGPVSVSLVGGGAGGALGGTHTVNASGGVATFSGLTLNAAGNGAILQASGGGLVGASTGAVSVIAPPAAVQSVAVGTQHVSKLKSVKVIN